MAYIPFIYFTLLILFLWRRNRKWGAGLAVLSFIDVSAFFSILVDVFNLYGEYGCNDYALTLSRVLLYCLLWTILLYPLLKIDSRDIALTINKEQLYVTYCWFVVAAVIIYILGIGSITIIKEQLQMSGAEAYEMRQDAKTIAYQGKNMFWIWIPMIIASGWPAILMMWFVNQLFFPQRKVLNSLLLLSSFMPVIIGLSSGGRGAFIWWFVTFYVLFSFFKRWLSSRLIWNIYRVLIVLILIAVPLFVGITITRFGNDGRLYAWYSIVGYAGQMLNNFSMCVAQDNLSNFFVDRVFPLYNFLVNGKMYINTEYYDILSGVYNMHVSVFTTVFGTLLLDVGVVGLVVFLLIYLCAYKILVYKSIFSLDISNCFVMTLLLCVPIRGLFGHPFSGHVQSAYILYTLLLYFVFRYRVKVSG